MTGVQTCALPICQYAIMAIRARETEIRSAGFPSAADAFAAAAEQRLTSDGVLTDRL